MSLHARLVGSMIIWLGLAGLPVAAHPLEGTPILGGIHPRISAQGDLIAFSHQGSIWRVSRLGGEVTQMTDGTGFDCFPAWSPDGRRLALIRGRSAFSGPLRVIDAQDGSEVTLPKQVVARDQLFFSPDGNRILGIFQAQRESSLCWFNVETGELGNKILDASWGMRYALSPDGQSIAFVTTQDVPGQQGGNQGPQCDVWIIPAEGGEAKKLVQFPGRIYDVRWGVMNQSLILVSNLGGVHNDLWRVPLDKPVTGAVKLTFGQADEDSPSVDSSGRFLVYTDNHLGPTLLMVRDLVRGISSPVTYGKRRFKRPTGYLELLLSGDNAADILTARVSVQHNTGKYYAPSDALYRMLRGELHFYCRGKATLELPIGQYTVKVSRGPEYLVEMQTVEISEAETLRHEVKLRRWINQRERHWYSGESHIHANYGYGQWYNSPRTMLAQSAGEDLVVSNFMVANSEADGVFDREYFRGRPDPISNDQNILYWNQEFRSTIWGHLTLLNLKHLVEPIFTGFAHTTHPHDHPTNSDISDHTHDQSGHVNYTHPAHNIEDPYLSAYSAKALPLDVALGKVDSMDVMGANHLATMPLWYRLLNCGFRVPASAGTDCFLNRVVSKLPGQDRVYVYVEEEFSYQKWINSLRAGRTFVTNGPMLEFKVNKRLAGSTLKLQQPGSVTVSTNVHSRFPIDQYEIILNGEVVESADLSQDHLGVPLEFEVPIQHSGWIALRVGGPRQAEQPTGTVFAHSSAVYLDVTDAPLDATEHAAYFADWIDRLRRDIRARNRVPSRHQVHVETQMAEARAVFNALMK